MQGGATGSGTVTLLAPVTNTNRTLTLPDVTDTVAGIAATQTLTNKTLTSPTLTTPNIDSAQFATVSGTAPIYPCRAWVNFNGTGTPAIRGSGNVSSITDSGTGSYRINFTTALPDANYAVTVGISESGVGGVSRITVGDGYTTTYAPIFTLNASSLTDYQYVQAIILR
jgi:hypothetical protein